MVHFFSPILITFSKMSQKKGNYADDYIELLRDELEKVNNEVWYEIIDIKKEYS